MSFSRSLAFAAALEAAAPAPLALEAVALEAAALEAAAPAAPAPPAPRKPGTTAQRRCVENWRQAVIQHRIRVQASIKKRALECSDAVNRYNLSTGGRAPELCYAPAKNARTLRARERDENREQLEQNYASCDTTGGMPPANCRAPCKRRPPVAHA